MYTLYHSFQYLNSDSIWIRGLTFCRNEKENAFQYVTENNQTEYFNVNFATNSTTKSTYVCFFYKMESFSSYYKLLKHIAWTLKLKQKYISYKRNKEHQGLPFTNLNIKI